MRLPFTDCPSKGCVGQDLNLRTPTGQDPEPCAFDQAWQPTHVAASKRFPRFVIIFRSWEPVGRSRTDSFGLRGRRGARSPETRQRRFFMIFMKPPESYTSSFRSPSVVRNSSQVMTSMRSFRPFVN